MILCFVRDKEKAITISPLSFNRRIQQLISWQANRLSKEIGSRKVIMWGWFWMYKFNLYPRFKTRAYFGWKSEQKRGWQFCGQPWCISYGPDEITRLQQEPKYRAEEYCIVISSAFHQEIRAQLSALDWKGKNHIPL